MVLNGLKEPKKAKIGIRKVGNGHETVKKGSNFAFRSRQKMPKNEPNFCKRTHRAFLGFRNFAAPLHSPNSTKDTN